MIVPRRAKSSEKLPAPRLNRTPNPALTGRVRPITAVSDRLCAQTAALRRDKGVTSPVFYRRQ